jgi:hypothetical protein
MSFCYSFTNRSSSFFIAMARTQLTIDGELTTDLMEVASYLIGLSVIRFTLSGIVSSWLKDVPCIFQYFSKGLPVAQARKLHENLWYAIWHTVSFVLGVKQVFGQAWIRDLFGGRDTEALAGGYPQSASSMGFKHYYLFEMGFWLSCCLFLGFETKRRDFKQMIIHHSSTVILVAFSFLLDFCRGGILVMILHDVGDIFLYAAKSAQYRGWHKLADMIFMFFAVVFFFSRLFLLPVAAFYPLAISIWRGPESPGMSVIAEYGQRWSLAVLTAIFACLIMLHCNWGAIITRMIIKTVRAKNGKTVAEGGDPRSDDESTSQAEGAEMKAKKIAMK